MMALGYVIAPEHQGKGFATEAVQACIHELFRMGYEHVRAGYFEGNTASRRVMEKLGMQFEGIQRDAIHVKGQYVSVGVCAILRGEYLSLWGR
jgi:ribosomal-protein-alanine N-acetyltransferase